VVDLGGLGPLRPVPVGPAVALSHWEVYLRCTTSCIGVLKILTGRYMHVAAGCLQSLVTGPTKSQASYACRSMFECNILFVSAERALRSRLFGGKVVYS